MKKFNKNSIVILLALSFVFVTLGFSGPTAAHAATAPDLGAAASYAVFGKALVANNSAVGTTHIWGNVGADATAVTDLDDATQVDGVIDAGAGVEAAILSAYGALNGWGADGGLDLAGIQTVTPGVYTVGATTLNGNLTLNGAGVYIFRSSSSISADPGAQVTLTNGACASNVFWQVPNAFAIGAGAHIEGTIITSTSFISLGADATLKGRALSRTSQVTLINDQITAPTCSTITVAKTVVNDSGGTRFIADFPLFVNGAPVVSGVTNTFSAGTYTVTETANANYTQAFSGDCPSGIVTLALGENKVCVITNDDIQPGSGGVSAYVPPVVPPVPPLIDVVKVPSPLALPTGPGPVAYTYTLSNIGTVPVTDVTMVGDTCSPITLTSGDTNTDAKLDVNEAWVYNCSTTLSATHTNTVTATGWANGISAIDIASATVVVGVPTVPPLIHVTKIPSQLALLAGGGMVTYTKKVTNPGTIALSNVRVTDDKCGSVNYISGDTNGDSKLDTTETWTYTCQMNLTKTTVNTATASGEANGLTARDFAIATVVVAAVLPTPAVPKLPNTGLLSENNISWNLIVPAGIFTILTLFYFARRKQTA